MNNRSVPTLTPRELQIVELVWEGLNGEEIGEQLNISKRTVEVHRMNAMRKFGVNNTAQLIRILLEEGIITVKVKKASSKTRLTNEPAIAATHV